MCVRVCEGPWCVCVCEGPWCVCVCVCEGPWCVCVSVRVLGVCVCVRARGMCVCNLCGNRLTVLLLFQAAQPWRATLIRASLGGAGGVMMEWRWQALGTEVWGRVTPLLPCSWAQREREAEVEVSETPLLFGQQGSISCRGLVAT